MEDLKVSLAIPEHGDKFQNVTSGKQLYWAQAELLSNRTRTEILHPASKRHWKSSLAQEDTISRSTAFYFDLKLPNPSIAYRHSTGKTIEMRVTMTYTKITL